MKYKQGCQLYDISDLDFEKVVWFNDGQKSGALPTEDLLDRPAKFVRKLFAQGNIYEAIRVVSERV